MLQVQAAQEAAGGLGQVFQFGAAEPHSAAPGAGVNLYAGNEILSQHSATARTGQAAMGM